MIRPPRPNSVLLGVLVLIGCRPLAPAPAQLELQVPAAWSADVEDGGGYDGGAAWWTAFGDQRLDDLLAEALAGNRDLRAATARVAAARARARIEGAPRLPAVGASAAAQRQKQVFVGLPVPGGTAPLSSTATRYDVGLDVSWELDLWGRLAAQHDAARSEALASAADREAVRLSLAAQVSKAWFALKEALLQVALSERTVTAFEETRRIVRERYENGLVPVLDLRLAESDEASARAQLEVRLRERESAVRQLELLLGRYPAGTAEAEPELPAPPPPVPVGVPAAVLERRPDLVAARLRLAAADARIEAARGALLPRISLTGSGGLTSDDLQDVLGGDFGVWSLLGNLVQPVFEGGRLRAGVDLAEADARESAEAYAATALIAFFEVEEALAAERILAGRLRHLELASSAASEAATLAEDRYESGLVDLLTVLDAQRRALVAESTWLDVRRELLDARVDLHLSLGGGFPIDPAEQEALPPIHP